MNVYNDKCIRIGELYQEFPKDYPYEWTFHDLNNQEYIISSFKQHQSYILEHYGNFILGTINDNFIKSCKFFSLLPQN